MREKYPVGGKYCMMEIEPKFDEAYSNESGVIGIVYSYKGALHIKSDQVSPLYGDDLDRLIATLRRAKSAWLKAYRKEQRIVAKRKGRK